VIPLDLGFGDRGGVRMKLKALVTVWLLYGSRMEFDFDLSSVSASIQRLE
jgi:hypothetical protein